LYIILKYFKINETPCIDNVAEPNSVHSSSIILLQQAAVKLVTKRIGRTEQSWRENLNGSSEKVGRPETVVCTL
jgi:hypothetical protein